MDMEIEYCKGDATRPEGKENMLITHICNDMGGWGAGFVLALSKRWRFPEEDYLQWFASGEDFSLGKVRIVQVENDMWVANMIGQHDIIPNGEGFPPIRYDAVRICLQKVAVFAEQHNCSVHMPRMGSGLAGGKWELIAEIVSEELIDKGIPVTVYDL